MNEYAWVYLIGTLFGEVLLLGWWGMQQTKRVTPSQYFGEKWAQALFSGMLAVCGCVLWSEGYFVNLFGQGKVTLTKGFSLAFGAGACFFAHGIIWSVGKIFGLKPPTLSVTTEPDPPSVTVTAEPTPPDPPKGDNTGGN